MISGDWRVHLLGALSALALLGCGGGKQCALDTDCRLGERCTEDYKCVAIGRDGGADAGSGADAGDAGGADAGVDAGFDAGPGVVGVGTVLAVSEAFGRLGMEVPSHRVSASFAFDDGTSGDGCRRTDMGVCHVTDCPDTTPAPTDAGVPDAGAAMDGGGDAGRPAAPTAGDITVMGLQTVTLTPEATGTYPPATGSALLWDAASPNLALSAVGADAPAFEETLEGPSQVNVTGPALSGMADRGSDLTFTWMGSSSGEFVVRMTAPGTGTAYTAIECRFDPAAGMGVVPAGALASFPSGALATVVVTTETSTVVEERGWTVTLTAQAGARSGGSRATGQITFN